MMKQILTLTLFAAVLFVCRAQNLLNNTDFRHVYGQHPMDWGTNLDGYSHAVELLQDQGPQKENAVRLDLSKMEFYGQGGLRLVPGEQYEIGAWVRTKNFQSNRSGVVIYNLGWFGEAGAKPIPADTNGEWVKLSATITCPKPDTKRPGYFYNSHIYSFCIYATQVNGLVDFASPFLIPVSEKAKEFSRRGTSLLDNVRVVPVSPRLTEIPSQNAVIEFFWPNTPEGEIRCNLRGVTVKGQIVGHRAKLNFPQLPAGPGLMRVEIDNETGEGFLPAGMYEVKVLAPAPEVASRRLNNLVEELTCREIGPGRYSFFFKTGGWVYVKTTVPEIRVDKRTLSGFVVDGSHEFMCRVPAGSHEIALESSAGAPLSVRRIPEIMVYAFDFSFPVPGGSEFDNAFWEKYLLPNITTPGASSGWYPPKSDKAFLAKMLGSGRLILCSDGLHARKKNDPLQIATTFRYDRNFEGCGLVYDELNPASPSPMIHAFTEALWQLQDMKSPVCLWMEWGARLFSPEWHTSLISALSNVSGGQGKILAETYCRLWSDESLLEAEMAEYRNCVKYVKEYYPDYLSSLMMIAGGYLAPTTQYILLTSDPECDPKVGIDRFFQMCAADPVFEGLYGIGMYSIRESDEELVRWYGRLFRHYGIEGRKDLLSEKYGFQLKTEYLKNGDFTKGLEHWKTQGNVSTGTFEKLGTMQGRRFGRGSVTEQKKTLGDTAAVLPPGSSVTQTATGLIPGRRYSVTCIVAERKMIESGRKDVKLRPRIDISLSNADQIEYQERQAKGFLSMKVIFTAKDPQTDITFSAPPESADELLLNYVAFRPYFSGEEEK